MDDRQTGVDTGETGVGNKGGGVYDFHPLRCSLIEWSCKWMFKVKGEANGWALGLTVCA